MTKCCIYEDNAGGRAVGMNFVKGLPEVFVVVLLSEYFLFIFKRKDFFF